MQIQEKEFLGRAMGRMAVEQLAEYARTRLIELEKTKRLLILVVAVLVVTSSVIFVFSPGDRQGVAAMVGSVLLVLALGSIGASRFILKTPFASIETGDEPASAPPGAGNSDTLRDESAGETTR